LVREMQHLEQEIKQLKSELLLTAQLTGLTSHDTLICSQKLDEVIVTYQNRFKLPIAING